MRLAAGLRQDPLGSFNAPTDPLAAIGGEVLLLRGTEGRGGQHGALQILYCIVLYCIEGIESGGEEKGIERYVKGGDCLLII